LNTARLSDYLALACEAAQLGGRALLAHCGQLTHVRSKSSSGDLVTEADEASEAAILTFLKAHLPDHAFLAEESGHHAADSDWLWAIDPLDGTLNYAHQLPFFCVSLGLMHHGQPVLGVVYAPVLNELFAGYQGGGCTLNGTAIHVSAVETLPQSFLATGFPYRKAQLPDNNYAQFCYFADRVQDIRRPGSAALDLAYVACGRFDGFWERHLNAWDLCAGALLVQEAGGRVSGYAGQPLELSRGEILASNGVLHAELQNGLQALQTAGIQLRVTL
jgi:myo-inositol-1(or 4)-monophosphatase